MLGSRIFVHLDIALVPLSSLALDQVSTSNHCSGVRRRTSDEISFKATLYDLLVYQEAERQYFELRKQIVSQRDEMLGRLHKMEYGGPLTLVLNVLLSMCSFKLCKRNNAILARRFAAMSLTNSCADMDDMDDMDEMDEINMNDPDIPSNVREWLEKYEQHNLMRTNCYRLKAQVFGEPRVGASQELGEGQAHAASLEETLRSRRGVVHTPKAFCWCTVPIALRLCDIQDRLMSSQMLLLCRLEPR